MKPTEPTLEQLKDRLTSLISTAIAFDETVYRSSTTKYANESDLLSGQGSKLQGGRWNPIGIAAVYGSNSPETAMAESLAHNRYYGIPVYDAMPRTFVAAKFRLAAVIDFRDGAVRQRLKVSLDRILNVDWRKEVAAGREPITQILGRAAWEVGLEGLIVPSSAAPGQHNVVVFPQALRSTSKVQLLNLDKLGK